VAVHVHASALDAVTVLAYIIILGAIWRTASAQLAERPIGQAMAFVF
jgi:hypothetical protein